MQAGGGPEAFLQRRELLRDVGRKGEAKRRCNFERRHRAQEVTLDCVRNVGDLLGEHGVHAVADHALTRLMNEHRHHHGQQHDTHQNRCEQASLQGS